MLMPRSPFFPRKGLPSGGLNPWRLQGGLRPQYNNLSHLTGYGL